MVFIEILLRFINQWWPPPWPPPWLFDMKYVNKTTNVISTMTYIFILSGNFVS